jgi:hypothetical protein
MCRSCLCCARCIMNPWQAGSLPLTEVDYCVVLQIHGKSRFPGLSVWLADGTRCPVCMPQGCLLCQVSNSRPGFLSTHDCHAVFAHEHMLYTHAVYLVIDVLHHFHMPDRTVAAYAAAGPSLCPLIRQLPL